MGNINSEKRKIYKVLYDEENFFIISKKKKTFSTAAWCKSLILHASLGISHWEVQVPLRISYKHCKTLKFLSRNKCKLGFFCLFLSFLSCNIVQKTTFLPITLHIIWHHFVTFRSKSINSFIKDIAAICIYTITV